jgi:hypothetical protein
MAVLKRVWVIMMPASLIYGMNIYSNSTILSEVKRRAVLSDSTSALHEACGGSKSRWQSLLMQRSCRRRGGARKIKIYISILVIYADLL